MIEEIAPDAAWCWFGDPRAVYHAGQLFYGWTDMRGGVWVGQLDPENGARRRFRVGSYGTADDHGNPSLLVRGGRLVVFWAGHSGGAMRYRIASAVGSIESFGPEIVASAGDTHFTYPNPVQMAHNGHVYNFWRGGNFQPMWSRSNNLGGNVWSPARHLFSTTPGQRPYVKVRADGDSLIHFALTDGHPRNVETSIFYVRWHLSDNTFRTSDGTIVGMPGEYPVPVSELERVYDARPAGASRAWVWDLQLHQDTGLPLIAYATIETRDDHAYHVAELGTSYWDSYRVCPAGPTIDQTTEPHYSGGIAINPLDTDVVAVSRTLAPHGPHVVQLFDRDREPGQPAWGPWGIPVTTGTRQAVRPFFVRDAPADMPWRLMWMDGTYGDYLNFSTSLVGLS